MASESVRLMLKLSLLRHAKSSWDDHSLDDHDRPLNERGRIAAANMGRFLHGLWSGAGGAPDQVMCSTAARARETWSLVAAELPQAPPVIHEAGLYLAGADAVLQRLRQLPRAVRHAMIVGHNPDLQDLALALLASGHPEELAALRAKLPTCGLVTMDVDIGQWEDLADASARLTVFMSPKRLS